MQNQHVIAFKNQVRMELYIKLKSFRDPSGNLASPTRGMMVNVERDLTEEIVKQYT